MNRNNKGWVRTVCLTPPTLQDNTADADRLADALKSELKTNRVDIDLDLLKKLPEQLRKWAYQLQCVVLKDRDRWFLTDITDSQDSCTIAGLAVDLGTSRVVLRLLNLSNGQILNESSFHNPQVTIASDVLARIHYADIDGGLKRLNELIINSLNENITKLCRSCKLEPADIYMLSVAGNTTMSHLFMGLNPHWIIREPYIPAVNRPGIVKTEDLNILVNPSARAFIFPNSGSYFGGDLVAGILFSGLNNEEKTSILVDVGTNAEVVLGNSDWLIACAGAAGPALEGGVTRMGMMAGPGVIDRIAIEPASLQFQIHTIEDLAPQGICGSGLIDLAAHLYLSGMIEMRGKFVPSRCGNRLKEQKGVMHLVVVPASESATGSDLTISQADLDSLIRSKAAMYTILETLMHSVGSSFIDLSAFYVAGTFGSLIQPESAISIGMLPDLPLNTYRAVGNSSLGGATMALISSECLDEIDRIRDRITYLELNVNQEFMNRFSAAKFIPHTDPSRFPSVKVWG
ncbi:MAG: DUF4445 domain-containing protein [Deltaproteobacteria bacterium]|nr:DUF4445 domain-containing protein [Deltaproteobacteria bacterium]MBW2538160.1 DUF4445 domain-containing protein [Deltaproteobacteria bacterium]